MDQPVPIERSPVVMQAAAEHAVTAALPVLRSHRGTIAGYGANVDTCHGFYTVEFRPGADGTQNALSVRVKATDFRVVWNSDDR